MIFNKPPSVGGNTEGEESNLSYTLSVFKKRRPEGHQDHQTTKTHTAGCKRERQKAKTKGTKGRGSRGQRRPSCPRGATEETEAKHNRQPEDTRTTRQGPRKNRGKGDTEKKTNTISNQFVQTKQVFVQTK